MITLFAIACAPYKLLRCRKSGLNTQKSEVCLYLARVSWQIFKSPICRLYCWGLVILVNVLQMYSCSGKPSWDLLLIKNVHWPLSSSNFVWHCECYWMVALKTVRFWLSLNINLEHFTFRLDAVLNDCFIGLLAWLTVDKICSKPWF